MSATIADIAKKAGASVSTVSRVLNNKAGSSRISKKTEKLVLKTARELNYKPNQLARGLRLKRTHTIGLVLPDISNPFFAYVTRSIQTTAHDLGYDLMVCDTNEDLRLEVEHVNLLVGKGIEGLIVMPVGQKCDHLELLLKDNVPLVLMDRVFDELETYSVVVDNYKGAFDAVEHVVSCGHVRIAIIKGLPHTSSSNGRLQGYRDALARHGISVDPNLIVGSDFRRETGYIEMKLLLRMPERPTAVFATSDLITLGALQAIEEENLRIPEDISLVAFDDFDFAPFLRCALTAVAQPKENMGEIAVKLLVEQFKGHGKKNPKTIILKPNLIVRNSVQRIAVPQRLDAVPA